MCVCVCVCIQHVKIFGHDYEYSVSCIYQCVFERMMDVTVDVRQGESFLRTARYFRINLEVAHETRKRERVAFRRVGWGWRNEKIGKGTEG